MSSIRAAAPVAGCGSATAARRCRSTAGNLLLEPTTARGAERVADRARRRAELARPRDRPRVLRDLVLRPYAAHLATKPRRGCFGLRILLARLFRELDPAAASA